MLRERVIPLSFCPAVSLQTPRRLRDYFSSFLGSHWHQERWLCGKGDYTEVMKSGSNWRYPKLVEGNESFYRHSTHCPALGDNRKGLLL